MQVRPVTGAPRKRYHFGAPRCCSRSLRWTFIVIGAMTAAAVLFTHLFHVNESIYDPSLFAIGIGGLFCLLCGVMLMVLSRNSRLRMELRRAKIRCEELADSTWELKEAEARATSLLEAQGDLIVRRDSGGRITYVNDAYCALAGTAREALLGTHDRAAVAAAGPRQRAAGRHAAARRADHDRRRRALARLARRRGLGREGRARRGAERRPRRHRPHRSRARARPRRATPPKRRAAPSRASSPWCRTRSARR